MPVNSSFAGRTYPPTAPYAVGREKIREFAEAVGAVDPVHTDRDVARARGYRDVIATPTFAVLVAQQCDKQLIDRPRGRHRLQPGGPRRAAVRPPPSDHRR